MTRARTYPHGVPCWVDTEQPDPEAARHFYGELFGWTFEDAVPEEAPGSYWIASLDGQDVAAIAPAPDEAVAWNTYVAVDEADVSAALIASSGGMILSAPEDAGPGGRAATCCGTQPRRVLGRPGPTATVSCRRPSACSWALVGADDVLVRARALAFEDPGVEIQGSRLDQ